MSFFYVCIIRVNILSYVHSLCFLNVDCIVTLKNSCVKPLASKNVKFLKIFVLFL